MRYLTLAAILAACSGCNTTHSRSNDDPRIVERVNQVCFTNDITSWAVVDNDRNALIAEMRDNTQYKLALSGPCNPSLAVLQIAVKSRTGGPCLRRGDKIKTDEDSAKGFGNACTVKAIYRWQATSTISSSD